MKKIAAIMVFVAAIAVAGAVVACPPGDHVTFKTQTMGHVRFSGMDHFNAGLRCSSCHTKIFPMAAPGTPGAAKFTMDDIFSGQYCGVCHNGKKAFAPFGNCNKCHHGVKKKSDDD